MEIFHSGNGMGNSVGIRYKKVSELDAGNSMGILYRKWSCQYWAWETMRIFSVGNGAGNSVGIGCKKGCGHWVREMLQVR